MLVECIAWSVGRSVGGIGVGGVHFGALAVSIWLCEGDESGDQGIEGVAFSRLGERSADVLGWRWRRVDRTEVMECEKKVETTGNQRF